MFPFCVCLFWGFQKETCETFNYLPLKDVDANNNLYNNLISPKHNSKMKKSFVPPSTVLKVFPPILCDILGITTSTIGTIYVTCLVWFSLSHSM